MANYDSNYAIAQEISARIGVSPIPFDSVYSIALEIYNELGGEPTQFDSVYSILLGILPLVEGGVASKVIDDSVITTVKTWSSSKINSELSGKQNTISDLSDIRSGATLGATALQSVPSEYVTDTELSTELADYATTSAMTSGLAAKQDTLTAGTGIEISGTTISTPALVPTAGWNYATKYIDDDTNLEGTNVATGNYSNWAEGSKTTATSTYGGNHAEGYSTSATGQYGTHSEGAFTSSSGNGSHAEGYHTQATAQASHAEGRGGSSLKNIASGIASHAEGEVTLASGEASHAEGWGSYSHNYPNSAIGDGSHVEGVVTIARNQAEHAEGTCNISHKSSNNMGNSGNTLSSIGFSLSDNWDGVFKNAREVMQNADMYIYGIGGYDGIHIKGEDSGVTVQTVQEVVNGLETSVAGKQDILTAGTNITISGTTISATYEVATTADIEALFS